MPTEAANISIANKSNENMTSIADYKAYCEDLYNKYNIKHHEFLKYYLVIDLLFKILGELEDNNPMNYMELLSNWDLDISDKIDLQAQLYNKIQQLRTEFESIVQK